MSIAIMLSGSISKQPETRQTSKGNPFAFTTVRVPAVDGDIYASVTVFDSALVEILTGLKVGDPVTVTGSGKLSIYTPANSGDPRLNLSVTASRIICLTDRQATPRPRGNGQRRRSSHHQAGPARTCHRSKPTTMPSLSDRGTHRCQNPNSL